MRQLGRRIGLPLLLVFLLPVPGLAEPDRKIALTFDDLPVLGPVGYWRPREISNMILRTLKQRDISAAGFVVEERIQDDLATFVVLEDWADAGHIVGNHTFAHVDLHQLKAREFLEHVSDGQKYLKLLARSRRGFKFRYLRFPYLHQGDNEKKKKRVAKALYRASYEIAPATIKTGDRRFNRIFLDVENDDPVRERLKAIYLAHVGEAVDYGEAQSQAVFGRNIPHILWLHCAIATASFLKDTIQMLQERGYSFISMAEALEDPAFSTPEIYAGPLGLSFIDRVAATRGLPYDAEHGVIRVSEIEERLQQEP
jgi:peptidoglycan/xylan/chitin deacetylase (PgdA/CDA1 family)